MTPCRIHISGPAVNVEKLHPGDSYAASMTAL
jgi:hypothetical protein